MIPAVKFLFNDTTGRTIVQDEASGAVLTLPNLRPVDNNERLDWAGNKGKPIVPSILVSEWRKRREVSVPTRTRWTK